MLNPQRVLALIYGATERVIESGEWALRTNLTTDDDGDDPASRRQLQRSVKTAKVLRLHLDQHYEFGSGFAEPKEADVSTT